MSTEADGSLTLGELRGTSGDLRGLYIKGVLVTWLLFAPPFLYTGHLPSLFTFLRRSGESSQRWRDPKEKKWALRLRVKVMSPREGSIPGSRQLQTQMEIYSVSTLDFFDLRRQGKKTLTHLLDGFLSSSSSRPPPPLHPPPPSSALLLLFLLLFLLLLLLLLLLFASTTYIPQQSLLSHTGFTMWLHSNFQVNDYNGYR